ncbi:uncharacterized protein B0H18DRAFT_1104542 [Fomitopsis serialis]|uniref:uncharacterized protein n=1 Tax=Fomitopsis serialis TaxID=139415 RepID=UPI002007F75D|nr:uncharacterized protein B0H18DRAFT_1104542 [Neoantrodia serialis]KAH9925975.1 hypothetical protein B0H18DRAFT_1104542 [Neoantrodia serialis]
MSDHPEPLSKRVHNSLSYRTLVPPELLPEPGPEDFAPFFEVDQQEYYDSIVVMPSQRTLRLKRFLRRYRLPDEYYESGSAYSAEDQDHDDEIEYEDDSDCEDELDEDEDELEGDSEEDDGHDADEELQEDGNSDEATDGVDVATTAATTTEATAVTRRVKPSDNTDIDWSTDSGSESEEDDEDEIICTGHKRPHADVEWEREPVIPDFDDFDVEKPSVESPVAPVALTSRTYPRDIRDKGAARPRSSPRPTTGSPSTSRRSPPSQDTRFASPPPSSLVRFRSPSASYGKTKPSTHSAAHVPTDVVASMVSDHRENSPVDHPAQTGPQAPKVADRAAAKVVDPAARLSTGLEHSGENAMPASVPVKKRKGKTLEAPAPSKRPRRGAASKFVSPSDSEEEATQVEMKLEAADEDYVPKASSTSARRPRKRRLSPDVGDQKEEIPRASKRRRVQVADDTGSPALSMHCKWAGCNESFARRDLPQHVKSAHVVVPPDYQGKPGRYDVVCLWEDCPDRMDGAATHTVRMENLKKHIHSAMGTRYLCPAENCDKSFSRVWRLNDHIRSHHPGREHVTSEQALQTD